MQPVIMHIFLFQAGIIEKMASITTCTFYSLFYWEWNTFGLLYFPSLFCIQNAFRKLHIWTVEPVPGMTHFFALHLSQVNYL